MKKKVLFLMLFVFSVLLFACNKVVFTVTFDTAGGTLIENKEVEKGKFVERPTDPEKDGFDFKGWWKESNHQTEWKFELDKVEANVTIYAKWEESTVVVDEKVKVTFDFNFSGSAQPIIIEINKGSKVTNAPTTPARDDFEFVAWSTSRTQLVEFDLTKEVNADVIVYANWRTTKVIHTVIVDLGYDNKTTTQEIADGELIEVDEPTRDGYLFAEWLIGDKPFDLETPVTENMTIVAKWILDDSGLEGTPIVNAAQLIELFETGGSGSFYLATDIEMDGVLYNGSKGSGDTPVVFSGTLDGNGKRIKNLNVVTEGNKTSAMFGVLDGATIKNLIIVRSSLEVPGEGLGFIGTYAYGGTTFEDITFINVRTSSTGSYAGLLYADNQNDKSEEPVTIKNIVVVNDSSNVISANRYVGALVGHVRVVQTLNVENVFIKSNIMTDGNSTAGSIVGRVQASGSVINVNNLVFEGELFGTNYVGAVIGEANTTATVDLKNVLITNSKVHSSGGNVNLLVGRTNDKLVITTENVSYSNTEVLRNTSTVVPVPQEQATEVTVTETWFNDSTLNKDFFKFEEDKINHKVDLGVRVAETLTISKSSYNELFVKGVDTELDLSELVVSVSYSDGTTVVVPLSELTIDSTEFDKDNVGEYTILVTFDGLEGVIKISVVEIKELEVFTFDIALVFIIDEVINLDKIIVHAILEDGSVIILKNEELVIEVLGLTVGEQTVKVTFKDEYEVTFNITIVEEVLEVADGMAVVTVDQDFTGVSGSKVEGMVTVKTVKEAINLIEKSKLDSSTIKRILIKDGLYFEKLRVATPNVHIIGESRLNTIIDFDQASGNKQPNGSEWGTQGSATFTISSAADGFIAHNLTISNSFDYYTATVGNKQAVALVNEADRALFYQVNFKGQQDTLYAKNGRQWYLDVYVEGIVDYIFGNGGPAFFEDSVIHTLKRTDTSANAVITANQGLGSSTSQNIKYGYVIYNSTLTAEEGVLDGTVDLGRPWRAGAAVAYINNTFGSFVSEAGWVEMSGNKPENANFFEFGNKVNNETFASTVGKQLTAEEALIYMNKDVIFDIENGDVKFADKWDYLASLFMVAPELFATVTLDVDGELTILNIVKGQTVGELEDPVKAKHTFDNWLLNDVEFNLDTVVTEDITLVASFTAIPADKLATVTFMIEENVHATVELVKGETVGMPVEPTLEGHTFLHWLLGEVEFDFETEITEDTTLVANFEVNLHVPVGTAITTKEEFYAFATTKSSGEYYLANDLDFTGFTWEWVSERNFTGLFDGNFKKISNLTIVGTENRTGIWYSFSGEMKNITFINANISSTEADARAGLIAGEITNNAVTFTNITVDGLEVRANHNNGAGGLVGYVYQAVNVNNISISNANIINGKQASGGLFGRVGDTNKEANWNLTIRNIFLNNVNVMASNRAGGLIGESNGTSGFITVTVSDVVMKNVNVKAAVVSGETETRGKNAGAITGRHQSNPTKIGTVNNVYFEGTIIGDSDVAHVTTSREFESVNNFWFKGIVTGTIKGTTTTNILEDAPTKTWFDENLVAFSTNAKWTFDSSLEVYRLK